tara:strand:+ start:73 stop:648 length:576 start_codon:yes stop_codon:yes gene_type:complete
MNFCSICGSPVTLKIPPNDNLLRYVCIKCSAIHYQNPKIVVGAIPYWNESSNGKILLCRRAIEPRYGFWTLPAGFLENNETTGQAAVRETYEEAQARIDLLSLYTILNVAHAHQVHLFYRSNLLGLDFSPGIESLDVQLFSESEVPWDKIAFPTVTKTLELFFQDLSESNRLGKAFGFYTLDIEKKLPVNN